MPAAVFSLEDNRLALFDEIALLPMRFDLFVPILFFLPLRDATTSALPGIDSSR